MVTLDSNSRPGDLYIGRGGSVHSLKSFCLQPTATMENVSNGSIIGGGIGCLNLDEFSKVDSIKKSELIGLMEYLSRCCESLRDSNIDLKEKLAALKNKLAGIRLENLNLKLKEQA